jgi:alpha-ketoglutarate-dependent taurine dioxygenase
MRFEKLSLPRGTPPSGDVASQVTDALARSVVVHIVGAEISGDPLAYWEEVIRQIGSFAAVGEDPSGRPLEERGIWMDVRYDPRHHQSFRHFNSAQPLHTDGAYEEEYPGTAFFFCAKQAPAGGATLFLDIEDLVSVLQAEEPALFTDLTTVPVHFSKLEGKGKRGPIIDQDSQGWRVNWNYYRVTPGQGDNVEQIRERFHAFLQTRFVDTGDLLALRLETGEAVFFDDTRTVHGRHAYEAEVAGDRLLWKCYFNPASLPSPTA